MDLTITDAVDGSTSAGEQLHLGKTGRVPRAGFRPGITAVVPSIPPRAGKLIMALKSVALQSHQAAAMAVSVDHEHSGAAVNRNRALFQAGTEWCAMIDDDDVWYPHHLATLVKAQEETGADLVYPWFEVDGAADPLQMMGVPFDPAELRRRNFIPVPYLVRTELAQRVGGYPEPGAQDWPHPECEDWGFLLRLLDAGARFHHVAEITWMWRHWGWGTPGNPGNTSGRADRW